MNRSTLSRARGLLDSNSWWSDYIGADCTQPLIIAKTVADSYGFVANTESSVSTSSYAQVVVRVKLSPHTRAAVYLIDTTEPDINDPADEGKLQYADKLKHETGISYRYDEDGNLVNLDPDDDNFDRRDNILLYYQDNGCGRRSATTRAASSTRTSPTTTPTRTAT